MRIPIAILVLANLAFFGWARWIAPDPAPPPDPLQATVPRLKLAREVETPDAPPPPRAPISRAPRLPATPDAVPAPTGGFAVPAATATGAPGTTAATAASFHCVTLGPFAAGEASGQAAVALREKGYEAAERSGAGLDAAAVEALNRSGANVSMAPCAGAGTMVASEAPPA